MRTRTCLILFLAAAGGCIPRESLGPGQMDRYWYLHGDPWPQLLRDQLKPLSLGERSLPSRWVVRQEPSPLRSSASILAAIETLKGKAAEVEIAVSPDHAEMLAKQLAQARTALGQLREMSKPETPQTAQRWSETLSAALLAVEDVARLADSAEPGGPGKPAPEQLGWSAGPVIQMLMGYLNQRSGGDLLAGMELGEVRQLRAMLSQIVLRVGFALAGKQEPPALRQRVLEAMQSAETPAALEQSLRQMLRAALPEAPPAPPGGRLSTIIHAVLVGAPPMFRVFEEFLGQWDRMESLTLEFGQSPEPPAASPAALVVPSETSGQPVAAVTIQVAPRREVRIAGLFLMQPAIVFRGGSRIVLLPKEPTTGETIVLFEQVGGGSTEVHFEGAGYGLVRLLALPLADAALREIRVATGRAAAREMITVIMLMQATRDRKDPRRMIVFHDIREKQIVRKPFEVFSRTQAQALSFTYLTPSHRYTYRREKSAEAP